MNPSVRTAGQATAEYLVVLLLVALVLFTPWAGGASLAGQLQRAVGGFLEASLQALALV